MIVTDSNQLEAGVMDFVYVCKKQPFAITCSPYLPKINETYIDMDIVLRMNIPIKNIQCTRITYAGQNTRVVGQISQTIQCVVAGKLHGTAHLKAKVVRDLSKLFHADCVAGQQLFNKLMDTTSTTTKAKAYKKDNNYSKQNSISGTNDIYTNISAVIANDTGEEISNQDEEYSSDSSYDDELVSFLAMQTEEARAQAVLDYPELARCLKPRKPGPPKHSIPPDPVLATFARKGMGPNDACIMSINAHHVTHMVSTMPATNNQARLTNVYPTTSDLSSPSPFASDLGKLPPTELIAIHSGHDDSLDHLIASHGYGAIAALDQDLDQVSLNSDTAEFFCRLCQRSDQADIVTFSHNLMDPSCPSMMYEDPTQRETDSDGSTEEEDDVIL